MNINLPYIIDVAIAITVFYLAYVFLFSNVKMFAFNRIYLISSMLVSFVIPLITFTKKIVMPASVGLVGTAPESVSSLTVSPVEVFFGLSWQQLLELLFILGFTSFLVILVIGHINILMIIRKSSKQSLYGHYVLVTQKDILPFNYFDKLIIPSKIINTSHIQSVIYHENIHKKELHCIDLLLMEIMFLFQWFNPFAWLMKKAVRDNLEFMTDDKVAGFVDKQEYQLGIIFLAGKTTFYPFPSLSNQSQLKKRIIMMTKNKQSKFQWIKTLIIIPVLAFMTITLSGREVQITFPETEAKTEEISITVDKEDITSLNAEEYEDAAVDIIEEVKNNTATKTTATSDSNQNTVEDKTIKGMVNDENNQPMVGVIVLLKGSTKGMITDVEGKYELANIPNDGVLLFQMFNYENKEVAVNDQNIINVQLEKSVSDATPDAKSVAEQNSTTNISVKLTTHSTNDDLSLQIRSKNDSKFPSIFIVDGKKYTPVEFFMSTVKAEDIEAMSVLKDNEAFEKYGEEGKNGVIIITTKK